VQVVPVHAELDQLKASDAEVCKLVDLATDIVVRLQEAGHEAYFVGGAVRDILMGRVFSEVDITTSARPPEVRDLFRRTIPLGEAFGVIAVVSQGIPFEVATFRSETGYTDGRHPDEVTIGTLEEDVQRRDFTINGLVLDPVRSVVLDLVEGMAVLQKKVLRAIGDPVARMNEDYLRTVRAMRFAASLTFDMEPATEAAVRGAAGGLEKISRERIHNELDKLILHRVVPLGLRLIGECGLTGPIFGMSVRDDRMEAAATLIEALPDPPGMADMLAAVTLATKGSSLLEEVASAEAERRARREAKRLRLSNADRKRLAEIFSIFPILEELPNVRLGQRAESYRRESFGVALHLERERRRQAGESLEPVDEMWQELLAFPPERLAGIVPVTGHDLIQHGLTAGPQVGSTLKELSYLFVEGKIASRDEALKWLEKLLAR